MYPHVYEERCHFITKARVHKIIDVVTAQLYVPSSVREEHGYVS
jgi:hypothetical protein